MYGLTSSPLPAFNSPFLEIGLSCTGMLIIFKQKNKYFVNKFEQVVVSVGLLYSSVVSYIGLVIWVCES